LEGNLFIVAACVYKKIENVAVAVGCSTSLCRNVFTSRERLLKAFTLVQKIKLLWNGIECKGNACLGRHIRARHHMTRHSRTMHVRSWLESIPQLRAMHDMTRHVMIRHVRIMHIRVMHVMVWNVREMHVRAEISGQGIIWQGT
jgi:hypothetical protein